MNSKVPSMPEPIDPSPQRQSGPPPIVTAVCCVTFSLAGLSLGLFRLLHEGAIEERPPIAKNVSANIQMTPEVSADVTTQTEAWERQLQEALERVRAARVAYAILRNRGNLENDPACECQVRRAELADCEARKLGQQIRSITIGRRPLSRSTLPPIGPGPDPTNNQLSNAETIPDRLWRGGNDVLMDYHPQTGADAK